LYAADIVAHIVKITPDGTLSIFAGGTGAADGTGTAAKFNSPGGLTVDANDNIYVADDNNFAIRKITPQGVVTTFAGSLSKQGSADGIGAAATFSNPVGITIDKTGNLYVSDVGNNSVRKITPAGVVTTIAGAQAGFNSPTGIAVDADGNIYVSDSLNNVIKKITAAGAVSTFAGAGSASGHADGPIGSASFFQPNKIMINAAGEFYIADSFNNLIRKIVKQ
jgi:sugar lactone lactonase YvrE